MVASHMNLARLVFLVLISTLLVASGCRRKAQVTANRVTITTTTQQASTFDTAIDFLNELDEYRPETVQNQILANLQDWSVQQETSDTDWVTDPMINDIPEAIRPTPKSLEVMAFERYDVTDLQEAVWMRDVAKVVLGQPLNDPDVQKWLTDAVESGELAEDHAADLALTFRLFDWTVRNTQLDEVDDKDDVLTTEDGEQLRHRYRAWENMLYGHADWLERARMFILLARQVGIDCVMLEADRGSGEPAQPWAVAAMMGEKLYLFDPLLGIPLPGKDGASIGTLTEYAESPELLDELVAGSAPYRIATSDLTNLVANVDASPTALSLRMKQIESRLSGKLKMALTATPTTLARSLRSSKYISSVKIWLEPYKGFQFLRTLGQNPSAAPALMERMQREKYPFDFRSPLMQARLLHLRGKFRSDIDNPESAGANSLYMDARISERELATFSMPLNVLREAIKESADVVKESPLLVGLPDDPAEAQSEYERRVAFYLKSASWNKDYASIMLAMIAADKQEFDVAKNHLTRLLENEQSNWLPMARYNLARAYETLGRQQGDKAMIDEAIKLYESGESTPQHAGNLLRAKRLKSLTL